MRLLAGLARACHPAPTVAMTTVITLVGVALGWRGPAVVGVATSVFVGQLSVGWSNDAFDAAADIQAGRSSKPVVAGLVTARRLWWLAGSALVVSCALSWAVAGWVGGSFHVFSLAMAWLYNTVLSRTPWSWLPYALAFGAVPGFLTYGLDGQPPDAWLVTVFAVVGVSAHLANALPDLETDRAAGLDGVAVRLGARATAWICWLLLAAGSAILAVVVWQSLPALAVVVAAAYGVAVLVAASRRQPTATFRALIAVVLIDVCVLIVASAL